MKTIDFKGYAYEYQDPDHLKPEDLNLLNKAKEALKGSYSPYSNYKVGAAVLLANSEIVMASNQENASYPAGVCAERIAILSANAQFPGVAILKTAITVKHASRVVADPVGPCGICRQTILEAEGRQKKPIELILRGEEGPILIVPGISNILPLHFDQDAL